jgi:hypothetical protein
MHEITLNMYTLCTLWAIALFVCGYALTFLHRNPRVQIYSQGQPQDEKAHRPFCKPKMISFAKVSRGAEEAAWDYACVDVYVIV